MNKNQIKAYIKIFLIVLAFFVVSYLVNIYLNNLQGAFIKSYWSMLIYFILINVEIVLGPASLIPFIPVASALWGNFASFVIVLLGWTSGSLLALLVARRIGIPLLGKAFSKKEVKRYTGFIPKKNLFLGVVIIRLLLPIDIMSYAIGFFTKIDWKRYSLATLIGYAPWSFFLAYFGDISLNIKILLGIIGIAVIVFIIVYNTKVKEWWGKSI